MQLPLRRLLALRCERYEYGRFKVWSEDDEEQFYLVDLLEYAGKGRCDCPDYRIHIGPVMEGTKVLSTVERESFVPACKHIVRATIENGRTLTAAMLKQEETINHKTSWPTTK